MDQVTLSDLKLFCKLAELGCSGNKKDLFERVNDYLSSYKYTPRYIEGLTKDEKFLKKFEIRFFRLLEKQKDRKMYDQTYSDLLYLKSHKPKVSRYTEKWNSLHKERTLEDKSKVSGVPLDILQQVYKRGLAAWRGSAHRPGATQAQWAVARVNSFLTCGKTWEFPDNKLADEAIRRSRKARTFWKKCKRSRL